jgi:hypothetical protein
MITLEYISSMWESLEQQNDLVAAHQFDHIILSNGSPFIVKDTAGLHHLLLPIGEKESSYEDKRSAGVHIKVDYWGDEGKMKKFIDVVCLKPHLNSVFDMMVLDILKLLDAKTSSPDKACRNILNKWRELLNKEPITIPDKNILLGVFGELWVLRSMIKLNNSTIDFWVGPEGSRFDFINLDIVLEVKTTLQRNGRSVTIHGEKQLEPLENTNLYLALLKFEEVPVGGERLIDIVNSIVDNGIDRLTIYSKLINLNITSENINDCSNFRLHLIEEKIYLVDADFPAITPQSFKSNKLPNGVMALTYQIDLSSEPPSAMLPNQIKEFYKTFTNKGD